MSQYIVRKELFDGYDYIYLPEKFTETELKLYSNWVYGNVHRIYGKEYDTLLNTEWVARHYLASKMVYSASIMMSSLEYSCEMNLKIVKPYLSYYAVLTCCRALLFVLPNQSWKDSGFIDATHSKIANVIKDACSKLNTEFGNRVNRKIELLRVNRELFSYRFPASGIVSECREMDIAEVKELCSILCEIAQLTSEQIENYYTKNFSEIKLSVDINSDYIQKLFCYPGYGSSIIDEEDLYRIDYIRRKQPLPTSIWMMMSEGMTEDFFAPWCPEDDNTGMYNPDIDWSIIFQVP